MRHSFLPYALPSIGEDEIAEVADTLRSGWLSTGPKVKRFEQDFAAYTGAAHAIAVSSCTAALHIALAAHNVGPGDEVIVPTMTFCATANVVAHLGATPVIVDVDADGLATVETIGRAITDRTRAIVPVHYGGQACDIDAILQLASSSGLPVIEDAAHAIGCQYKGKRIGGFGAATAFSFYATKNMTTGEGGMITTDDASLAARMRQLALHGMSRDAWNRYGAAGSWYYEVAEPGFKSNMTDMQAAIGIHQLRRLDSFIVRRQQLAALYRQTLSGLPGLTLPVERPGRNHVYHLFPVHVDASTAACDRSTLIQRLRENNVGASVHFIPLHRHPYYQQTLIGSGSAFPVADQLFDGLLSLPLYPGMSDDDVHYVSSVVRKAVGSPATLPHCA
ncbi:MAG TPA: DegT/DnrJ/EryC1/StrS aminotransferase family protein [Bryobacteraceae bacterium]|nr:DegT/DnrJ/EryC1/StrS aminotransferase family protein [Bryobacteraceae bacterium]